MAVDCEAANLTCARVSALHAIARDDAQSVTVPE
jgi:hypothetical protein